MSDAEWMRAHGAGCELMGRGTGVPESLRSLADIVESEFGENVPDKLLAALGSVLLQRRADQAEMTRLRDTIRQPRPIGDSDLESAIDSLGLPHLLGRVADICHEKAEHVLTNWQDKALAGEWSKAARIIERGAATRTVMGFKR
jgi:hypothetical protein